MESNRNRRVNHCKWCGAPTEMEAMLLPETPILEFVENKIDKLGRNRVCRIVTGKPCLFL